MLEATPKFESIPNNAESLRAEKDRLLVAVGIVTNAVLDCGLDNNDVLSMRTLYIRRAEDCRSVKDVVHLRFNISSIFPNFWAFLRRATFRRSLSRSRA